jgi:hypothetical protein
MDASIKSRPHTYFDVSTDASEEQKTADSFFDRQVTLFISMLKHVFRLDNTNTIFDYGCGGKGNLFFDIASRKDVIDSYRIVYYGYDVITFDIQKDEFYKYIDLFANENKDFRYVFLDDVSMHAIKSISLDSSINVIVVKNVMHEVDLSKFEECFKFINEILMSGGYLFIIDQMMLKNHEPSGVAWHYQDIEELVCGILGYTSLPVFKHVDMILEEYEDENFRTPFYILGFQKVSELHVSNASALIQEFALNSQRKRIDFVNTQLMPSNKTNELLSMIYLHEMKQIKIQLSRINS